MSTLNFIFSGYNINKGGKEYKVYFEAALDQDDGHYHISLMRIER